MKVLAIADLHLSDRPPSSCTDRYTDDLFDLLYQTVELAKETCADAVVWGGDVFHIKAPSRNSHRLVLRVIEVIRSYPCPLFIVIGNHDIQNDRLDSACESQPLGVLFRSGALLLDGWAANGMPLYGVPWQQEFSNLRVFEATQSYRDWQVHHPGEHALVVAHAPLFPPGQESPFESYPAGRWAEAMCGGSCFYGHVHDDHGTYDVGDPAVTFCNFGALSRGSLHESELTRQVSAALWDSETGGFTRIALNARPAGEVFRLADHDRAAGMTGRLDDFLERIGEASLEVMSAESVIGYINGLGIDPADAALAAELITEAVHG